VIVESLPYSGGSLGVVSRAEPPSMSDIGGALRGVPPFFFLPLAAWGLLHSCFAMWAVPPKQLYRSVLCQNEFDCSKVSLPEVLCRATDLFMQVLGGVRLIPDTIDAQVRRLPAFRICNWTESAAPSTTSVCSKFVGRSTTT